jgi:hypothetical protein
MRVEEPRRAIMLGGLRAVMAVKAPVRGRDRVLGTHRLRSAQVICSGHAFIQNLRRGHYELGHDVSPGRRLEAIFTELALAM